MIDFQQKRHIKNIIYSKVSFIILFVLVIFLGRATYDIYKKSRLSSGNYVEVKRDYESLQARKEMLESEISRLKTDNGIEEEIRGKFNVAKPGETVVTIISGSSSTSTDTNTNKGFWSNFWEMFK
jgi:cell division protein FtsB